MKRVRHLLLICFVALAVCESRAIAEPAGQQDEKAGNPAIEKVATLEANAADQFEIGVSDILHIAVWNEPQLSATTTVKPDGTISLPLLKDVNVTGLTTEQVQRVLEERYKQYVADPRVSVTVSEIRSRKVFITGEIVRPGSYSLLTPTTVLQLIAQAGGFTPFSKRNKVFVLRVEAGRQSRIPFNYSKVTKGQNAADNIVLRPGDTVVVP